MTIRDLTHLHPGDLRLWAAVESSVWRMALASGCRLDTVIPTPRRTVNEAAGFCVEHGDQRLIAISLRRSWTQKTWGTRYKDFCLIDTIAHEIGHLRAGNAALHSDAFFQEFAKSIRLAEKLKIRVDIERAWTILPSI